MTRHRRGRRWRLTIRQAGFDLPGTTYPRGQRLLTGLYRSPQFVPKDERMDLGVSSAAISAIVALIPASVTLWRGRRLARMADDPALPERLVAHRSSANIVLAACMAFLAMTCIECLVWSIPLLLVARIAAAYPLRRSLLHETWSLPAYLWFFVRLRAAFFGFWILLCAAPALTALGGRRDWMIGIAIAVILVAWHTVYADAALWFLRAQPIADPGLAARFARIAERSNARPTPRLVQINLGGGAFANAVALPSARRPAAAFSETLLNRLDPDESAAICGHEIAHLEYYNAERMRRLSLVTYAFSAATAALVPAVRATFPSALGPVTALWPVAVLASLAIRARRRQQHETASDLRAIALAGNAEALVSALVKLHAMARVPRRWDLRLERAATHPSLARRIRAIRAAAGTPPASLGVAASVTAADGAASVLFEGDRLIWTEGSTATHTLRYEHLSELRVDARSNRVALLAADERGHRWTLALADADVARVQAVLDVVDARLATVSGAAKSPLRGARLMTAAVAFVAFASGHFAILIAALLAIARPAPALIAAVGAAAITAAGITSRDAVAFFQVGFAFVFVAIGVPLIGLALRGRMNDEGTARLRDVGTLAICAALSWLAVVGSGLDLVHIHQGVRAWPAAATMSLAVGAALAMWRAPVVRCAATFAALVGVIAVCAGSTSFLDAFSGDPLLTPARVLTLKAISPPLVAEFPVDTPAGTLQLSPAGRAVALAYEDDDDNTLYHVGRPGAALRPIDAEALLFSDDDHLLDLRPSAGGLEVREISVDNPDDALWRHHVAGVRGVRLSFDDRTGTWVVLARSTDNQVVRVSGRLDGERVQERRWTVAGGGAERMSPIGATSDGIVLMSATYRPGVFSPTYSWRLGLGGYRSQSRFVVLSNDGAAIDVGTSDLVVNCVMAAREDGAPVCAAFDGTRTHLMVVDPSLRRIAPLGAMSGRFFASESAQRGWMTGFWNGHACALNLATLDAVRLSDGDRHVATLTATTNHLLGALSTSDRGAATVRVYKMQ